MGEIAITKKCPVCGKQFVILYPHLWAYKRGAGKNGGTRYFCSWKCIRELDKEGERKCGNVRICTDENEREAVKIFLEGGDHFGYLKGLGIKNPAMKWYDIRSKLKETDPELYQKTGRKPKTVETPEGEFVPAVPKAPKAVEIPEAPKMPGSRYKYTGIDISELGEFYYDRKHGKVDWRTPGGDEISLDPVHWTILQREIPIMMQKLGVTA